MLLFIVFAVTFCKITLKESQTPKQTQLDAVKGLITRVVGEKYLDLFALEIDKTQENYFEISGVEGKVKLLAKDGIALSSAFYYYLKHFTKSSIEWQTRYITNDFPIPSETTIKKSLVKYRYIFNTCTFGYTLGPWNWNEWERLIDWMALHGINLPLSFTGQEIVWMNTFKKFGLSEEEMFDYFAGPLFLPWFRMGNMRKWGGPLSNEWLSQQENLQKKILERERSFGMQPVLPGFAGFIPDAFIKKYPNCSYSRLAQWAHFNETYSENYLLDPTDQLFEQVGETFIAIQQEIFGTDHIYNVDTFNEMRPKSKDPSYLKTVSQSVYNSMAKGDPDAVWMLQGWLFYNERDFWGDDQIEGYLSPVPNDKMIILDLFAEEYPVFKYHKSYFGKSFIWCMLKNFGGRRGLTGSYHQITTQPISDKLLPDVSMEGLGITSEAIYMPPFIYEVFSDMYLYQQPLSDSQRNDWLDDFLVGKYSKTIGASENIRKAWQHLIVGPYSFAPIHSVSGKFSLLDNFPTLKLEFINNSTYVDSVAEAIKLFYEEIITHETYSYSFTDGFLYDLVEFGRQYLSNFFTELYNILYTIYDTKSTTHKKIYSDMMVKVLNSLDELLSSNKNFLLGKWINDTRAMGKDAAEKDLFELNARNQLTLWGPDGEINDYAKKHWGGLVNDYYLSRWNIFFKYIVPFDRFNDTQYHEEQIKFEMDWQYDFDTKFDPLPKGDTIDIFKKIYLTYLDKDVLVNKFEKHENIDSPWVTHDIAQTVTKNIEELAVICDMDQYCAGFSSLGMLKRKVGERVTTKGVDLYIKK